MWLWNHSPRGVTAPELGPRADSEGQGSRVGGVDGYVWWLAGRRVTLQTRYFLFICPQCVITTFRPGDTGWPASGSGPTRLGVPAPRPAPLFAWEPPPGPHWALWSTGKGDTGLEQAHPRGCPLPQKCQGHSRDTALGEKGTMSGPVWRLRWPPGLSVPPSELFLATRAAPGLRKGQVQRARARPLRLPEWPPGRPGVAAPGPRGIKAGTEVPCIPKVIRYHRHPRSAIQS